MPRDGVAAEVSEELDPLTALPAWVKGEKRLSSMLPYVSLVTDRTIRTRGNELMQCIRLEGVNSTTSEDAHLEGPFRLQPPCGAPRQRQAHRWYGWPRGRSGWGSDVQRGVATVRSYRNEGREV